MIKVANERVEVLPGQYINKHRTQPGGHGVWTFRISGVEMIAPGGPQDYWTAVEWAQKRADSLGCTIVLVCP